MRKLPILSLAAGILILVTYILANPSTVYYRAWEYQQDFIFQGAGNRSIDKVECGDATRQYLFQRYCTRNSISVDGFGNRVAYPIASKTNQTLFIGDSQLWGSGVSDRNILTYQLGKLTGTKIINGSRRNGWAYLNSNRNIKHVVLTVTERGFFSEQCTAYRESYQSFPVPIPTPNSMQELRRLKLILSRTKLLIESKVTSLLANPISNFVAPRERVFAYRHSKTLSDAQNDLNCVQSLKSALASRGISLAAFYFPAAQTIYTAELPPSKRPDEFTLNYIPYMVKRFETIGVASLDTKKCLREKLHLSINMVQTHDTHLTAAAQDYISSCILNSKISKIFNRKDF